LAYNQLKRRKTVLKENQILPPVAFGPDLSVKRDKKLTKIVLECQILEILVGSRGGPDSNPRPAFISELSLLLVLVLAPRVFLPVLLFSSLH